MAKDDSQHYVQELYKVLHYSNEQFDKYVLFIASGALGISFAFIEKLVPNLEKAVNKQNLIYSWYSFAFVIFISLACHFISSLSLRWSIANYGRPKFERGMKNWNRLIRVLNLMTILGLLAGTYLLINFIQQNI